MSRIFLIGFSAVLHFYIGARIVPELALPWAVAFTILVIASALLVPMGLVARRHSGSPRADLLAIAGLFFLGLFSSLLAATFVRDVALTVAALVEIASPGIFSFARLEHVSAQIVPLAALFASGVGLWNARRIARVVRVEVPIRGLPPALHGFSIVQLSDVHVGPTIRRKYVEGIVEAVNALSPDVVAITGDLVDGTVPQLREHVAPLSLLAARHGRFFVTGNHEYYSGAVAWMRELERLGLTVLHNQHVVIEHQGEKLVMAGVPDWRRALHPRACERSAGRHGRRAGGREGARAARPPAAHRARGGTRGLRSSAVRAHARRSVPAVEFLRAPAAAVHGRAAPPGWAVGVRQPWNGLLGPAQAVRGAFGDHESDIDSRVRPSPTDSRAPVPRG
jgi:hypothetical protein